MGKVQAMCFKAMEEAIGGLGDFRPVGVPLRSHGREGLTWRQIWSQRENVMPTKVSTRTPFSDSGNRNFDEYCGIYWE